MMYALINDMSASDRAVEFAVFVLSIRHTGTFGYREIAQFVGVHERTVQNSMQRLIEANKVLRTGSARTGYRYEPADAHEINRLEEVCHHYQT